MLHFWSSSNGLLKSFWWINFICYKTQYLNENAHYFTCHFVNKIWPEKSTVAILGEFGLHFTRDLYLLFKAAFYESPILWLLNILRCVYWFRIQVKKNLLVCLLFIFYLFTIFIVFLLSFKYKRLFSAHKHRHTIITTMHCIIEI